MYRDPFEKEHVMRPMRIVSLIVVLVLAIAPEPVLAQTPPAPGGFLPTSPTALPMSMGNEYRVGQDDLLEITVFEVPELGTTGRVTASGYLSLPLVGPVRVSGMTSQELTTQIEAALRENFVNDPHVNVFVREYASQPVAILGAVKVPGIYQIKGQKMLLEMLAMAQGLTLNPGSTIQVIRGMAAPALEGANDVPINVQTVSIDIEDLMEKGHTGLNVPIYAGDVINVLQAGSVFVVGEAVSPGEKVLRNGRSVTVTTALALGGGFTQDAKRGDVIIIRMHRDGTREEILVEPDKIMSGDMPDVAMLSNDILWVPSSRTKPYLRRALDATIGVVTGLLVYRGR
jgi:polysaccharide export outer membrane protein